MTGVLSQNIRDIELRTALELMPNIGKVSVLVDSSSSAGGGLGDTPYVCADEDEDGESEAVVRIRFMSRQGDIPPMRLLKPDGTLLDDAAASMLQFAFDGEGLVRGGDGAVISSTKGTAEWVECSGRGICNRQSGECQCFLGYAAADQLQGRVGPVANCGLKLTSPAGVAAAANACPGSSSLSVPSGLQAAIAVSGPVQWGLHGSTCRYRKPTWPTPWPHARMLGTATNGLAFADASKGLKELHASARNVLDRFPSRASALRNRFACLKPRG